MNKIKLLFVLLFMMPGASLYATEMQDEINYLLDLVAGSQCEFIRNGSEYDADRARKHMEKKYHYFESDIKTTEDFIQYAATKSTMSGKLYQMRCGDQLQPSGQWLLDKLNKYRNQ